MAIWYVDFEGEAGTGDGTSFANRAKSIKALYNIASERDTGSQNSGGGQNGANTIGQADEIRIKKSPDPTLVGQGQIWKDLATNDYNYTLNNNGTITYSATKGQTTIYQDEHGLKTGEWVMIHNNSNSDAYINGWWKITRVDQDNFSLDEYTANSTRVNAGNGNGGNCYFMSGHMVEFDDKHIEEVAFTSRQAIAAAAPVMTAQSNVTCSLPISETSWSSSWSNNGGSRTSPEGGQKITISSSFTGTGKACHMQLPSTLNLSAYQQISLQMFFRQGDSCYNTYHTNPTYITQGFSLRLCSDNNGDTPVHTIPLNYHKIRDRYRLTQIVKDFGTNLSSGINSIAIYVDTARNIQREFDIGNIIACKASSSANSITHASLIGLNTTAAPQWYRCHGIFNHNGKTVVQCEQGSEQCKGRQAPGYYAQGCTHRWWPQSYNANTSGSTSIQIYKREDFWFQMQAKDNIQTRSANSRFVNMGGNNNPLIISGGWNATDMSTKTAGDMTFVDGHTAELGNARFNNVGSTHSNGSGGSYHADGEDKTCHFEDIYMSRMYGNWEYYRHTMSLCNVGCHNWGSGFYLYFTHRIKKFGLIILTGFDRDSDSSYHGINFGRHSEGGGISNATFLTNSDGTKHSTYDKTTRYIKWAAGSGNGQVVRIGSYSGTPQIDTSEWSVINTEMHYRSQGCGFSTGVNSRLEINNLMVGYGDGDVQTGAYFSNYVGAPIYIDNLRTTGCYSGFRSSNETGDIDVQNWVDDCFGYYQNKERYRGEYEGGFDFACQCYENGRVTIHDGVVERRPITYSGTKFFFNSLLIAGGNEDVYNHSGTTEVTNHQNISGNNYKFVESGLIYVSSSIRRGSSGYSLKMKTYGYNTVLYKIADVVFNGGSQVTVSLYMYKEHQYLYGLLQASNFSINSGLAIEKVEQLEYNTNNTNQWIQKNLTFTPTAAGSCEIYFGLQTQSSGSTNNSFMYLDDLTVTQA